MEKLKTGPVCTEDERAITAVILRYGTAIDMRDWALFRSCFSEDCETDYGRFGRWRGPREITDYMRETHAQLGLTLHRMTNISVESVGAQVRARSYVDALIMPLVPGGPVHRGIGWYDDHMVRTAEGWKISRRHFNPVKLD